MDDVWKAVLAEIELEVSKGTFLTFFKGTTLLSIENSVATISAVYVKADFLEKRYYSLIKKILDKKVSNNTSLVFVSVAKKQPSTKETIGPLFVGTVNKKPQRTVPQGIRKDFTFETLAVSESNQLAYTASSAVAKNPGGKYNPLFLYGTVGVGKTHLMHAIANEIFKTRDDYKTVYLTTEGFTNEVVEAIRDKTTTQLRKKFRNVHLLLLDDIQFLSGKEKVQEELFHTFNALIDKGGQIVFTSDKPPSELKKIEARLASRFESGLTVDIQPPDFELRTAILLKKSEKHNLSLTIDVAKIIADKILETRTLEGFLLRLLSEVTHNKKEITPDLVLKLLKKPNEQTNIIRPDDIIKTICSFYDIKTTQLKGVKRDSFLVRPRHVCMFLLKEETRLTYTEIGNIMGGRDHTTVMHAVEKIENLLSNSEKTKEEILFIKERIKTEYLQ